MKYEWLHKKFLLGMFSGQSGKAKKAYIDFVHDEDSLEVTDFFSRRNLASVFGSSGFLEWVKREFYEKKQHDEVPEARRLAPTVADIKKAVCQLYKIDKKELEQARRGQVNEPGNLAAHLSCKETQRIKVVENRFRIWTRKIQFRQ